MTLQEKRAEWGRRYREKKRLEAQRLKAQPKPVKVEASSDEITVVEADGTEHTYTF